MQTQEWERSGALEGALQPSVCLPLLAVAELSWHGSFMVSIAER